MSMLTRAYRVLAEHSCGDTHLIVTSSRARASHYLDLFLASLHYSDCRIELGDKTYNKKTLEQLP